jgi:beta-catenin-like protein 1
VLAYPELIRSGAVALLIGLLSHENADIVIDVVEVVHELTDEDVGNEGEEEDEENNAEALKILMEGLVRCLPHLSGLILVLTHTQLENSILELLVENLARLNEAEESDRQGIFHILGKETLFQHRCAHCNAQCAGIFENVLGFSPQLSTQLVSKTTMLTWLLNRIQSKKHDENRSYAAELLSILLQNNVENRIELGKKDGVEIFLKVLSVRSPLGCHSNDMNCSSSNIEGETLWMRMRRSSWRMFLMRCVQH